MYITYGMLVCYIYIYQKNISRSHASRHGGTSLVNAGCPLPAGAPLRVPGGERALCPVAPSEGPKACGWGCGEENSGEFSTKKRAGWWFGTFFIFPYIWNNHPNWLIFFRGVQTTNQRGFGMDLGWICGKYHGSVCSSAKKIVSCQQNWAAWELDQNLKKVLVEEYSKLVGALEDVLCFHIWMGNDLPSGPIYFRGLETTQQQSSWSRDGRSWILLGPPWWVWPRRARLRQRDRSQVPWRMVQESGRKHGNPSPLLVDLVGSMVGG